MRILITGAGGQLGKRLVRHFSPNHEVCGRTHAELDIGDFEAVQSTVSDLKPETMINAAAFTAVDRCEDEPEVAYRANREGPAHLAAAAKRMGAALVHFSTDFVFDGRRSGPPYTETDPTNPLSIYGKSKLSGEVAVLDSTAHALVLRLAWVYGPGGWNFVDWVTGEIEKGNRPRIVTDQFGSPTWVGDIAVQVERLLHEKKTGLYHCVGKGGCSRYDWASFAVRQAGLDPAGIEAIASKEFAQKAPRPKYSALDNRRLREEGIEEMRPWKEALVSHLEEVRQA